MRHVPTHIAAHIQAHPHERAADAAARFGVALSTMFGYRSAVLRDRRRATHMEVIERLTAGESYRSIRQHFPDAPRRKTLQMWLLRQGKPFTELCAETRFTPAMVARLFGYAKRNRHLIRRLRAAGVRLQSDSSRPGSHTYISADDLMTFFDNQKNWTLFDLCQIADPDWRDYAQTAQDRYHLRSGVCSGPPRPCDAAPLAERERTIKARSAQRQRQEHP